MFNIEDGFRVFHKIKDLKDRPSAIFTGNDQVAAGIIKQAMKNGFKVPEDLAVIGFDNQLICQVVTPTITTIDIPVIELGQQAVLKIIESISGNASLNRRIIKLPTKLIIREST